MFKDTLQELLEAELDENLGYEKYEYSDEPKDNYRNGYSKKTVHSTAGDIELSVPRDCNGEFEPVIVEKGEKDISGNEEKIIRMYARGTSNQEIYNQMQELYGVKDILIMCANGLKGLPEAINSAFPKTEFQRCIVHMIRNTMNYVSYKVRKELATDLKTIYAASTEEEAYSNLQDY